ncbi:MAG: hypothetical protein AABO58_19170 [Acidobacteriota bacterium]
MSNPIARRQFLKTGSSAALGLAFTAFHGESLFAAAAAAAGGSALLSVGYAPMPPATGEKVALAPAERTLAGDPAFIRRGARVTVGSYTRAAKYDGKTGSYALAAIYPAFGYQAARYPRFQAWTFDGSNGLDSGRRPVRFNVPVTAADGLQFAIGKADETRVALTLGSDSSALKLQRGVYVIALRETPSESVPPWSAHSIRVSGGNLVVDTTTFSYIVVTLDFAD